MRRAAALAALLAAPAVLFAQALKTDFVHGADIRTDASANIYRVVLPDDVYDTSTRADLADMRVLNREGETVPYTLREVPGTAGREADWRTVPSFPMTEAGSRAAARTQVKVGADGTVLEVTNDRTRDRATTAYLVDVSAVKEPLERMMLSWEAAADATFLVAISIVASDDLNRWETVVPSASIAQLRRDAATLTQNQVELPGSVRAKYLRVSWPRELSNVVLKSIAVRPRPNASQPEIHWRALSADRVDPAGTAQYDTHAFLPIEYLDLEFADPTDTASATIRSRRESSSPWSFQYAGLFFSLQGGRHSPYVRITRTSERQWIVETTREGGWRNRPPRLKVGWRPHELLFVAKGSAPFTLAYGSARVGPADAPVGELLASLNQSGSEAQVRPATLDAPRTLGGADALKPAPQRLPWKRIVLWGVLIIAVASLAFLATRLLRETKAA